MPHLQHSLPPPASACRASHGQSSQQLGACLPPATPTSSPSTRIICTCMADRTSWGRRALACVWGWTEAEYGFELQCAKSHHFSQGPSVFTWRTGRVGGAQSFSMCVGAGTKADRGWGVELQHVGAGEQGLRRRASACVWSQWGGAQA